MLQPQNHSSEISPRSNFGHMVNFSQNVFQNYATLYLGIFSTDFFQIWNNWDSKK